MTASEPWDDPLSVRYREAMRLAMLARLPFGRVFDPDLPEDDRRSVFDWYRRVQAEIRRPLAHAVPSAEAVHLAGLFSPIVEIGAGSGYWARLIRDRTGARVFAYDLTDGDGVSATDDVEAAVRAHPEAALFLCWPDQSGMASRAIRAYAGDTVLYIGEAIGRTLHDQGISRRPAMWHSICI